ncbi:hypothetical protein DL98DRAFT_531842 [Cadophora sp. DSE1049]|nr:hypothetical protein DL98DRAFT_531842 [Cadophora sp. DSE1049]
MNSTRPKQTVISVVWRTNQGNAEWTTITKIPTALAYDPLDDRGFPIAWGQGCENMGADQVKQCFKAFIGNPATIHAAEIKLWAPTSQLELRRWTRDYLYALCSKAADTIDIELCPGWRSEDVIWNFSVPGRWSYHPVVANFKQLAEDAVSSCGFRKECVKVLATEAEASAHSILNQCQLSAGNEKFAVGNVVISCDIGGATTDVAISEIVGPGKLASWRKLALEPRGVVIFEQRFWEHAEQVLRSAGAQEPETHSQSRMGMLQFDFPTGASLRTGSILLNQDQAGTPQYRISNCVFPGTVLSIAHCLTKLTCGYHSVVFEEFLSELVDEIQEAIDEAITVLRDNFRNRPNEGHIRAFNSGRMVQSCSLLAIFGNQPWLGPTLRPAIIVQFRVRDSFRHRDESRNDGMVDRRGTPGTDTNLQQALFAEGILIGQMLHSGFEQNSWVFTFAGKSREKTVKHRTVIVPAASQPPQTFKDACQTLHSRSWVVEVDLHDRNHFVKSVKYNIVCNISGPNEIAFEAQRSHGGGQLSCRSQRI